MSCTSSAAGSQQPSNLGLTTAETKTGSGSCSDCNSQLWSSYVVGLLACFLVVGGIFLAFHRWDYLWLVVSAVGVILILIGASLHYCGGDGGSQRRSGAVAAGETGTRAQKRKRGSNHHRTMCEVSNQNERLLPSAPPNGLASNGHNFSVSQLSLNMLPPFFPSYDTVSLGTQIASNPSVGGAVSPIMHLNGQSFLLLPIGGAVPETPSEANTLARRLSSHLAILEQQSFLQKRCPEAVNFGLTPVMDSFCLLDSVNAQAPDKPSPQQESELQVVLTSDKAEAEVQTRSETNPENILIESTEVLVTNDEEPIYQVPRLPSTPIDNNISQLNLVPSDPPTTEQFNSSSHEMPETILAEVTVEQPSPEDITQPTITDRTGITVQENLLPNNNNVPGEDVTEAHISQNGLENTQHENISQTGDLTSPRLMEDTTPQHEVTDSEQTDMTFNSDSRVSTPEPDWTLPPSYEEVALPQFKRLGHLKFAYETL